MGRYIKLSLALFLYFSSSFLYGQNIKFYANVDRDVVAVGETFVFEIVLENADGNDLQLPNLKGFKVVQGPSTSTSMTIINGSRSSSSTYSYLLMATSKGKFTIDPVTIQIKRRSLSTNAITINVNEGSTPSTSSSIDGSKETMIRLEPSSDQVYVGQQVILNFVLYTRQNISAYNFLNELDYTGFFAVPLQQVKEQPTRQTINGKEYHRQVLNKVILYPQKLGDFTLGPVNCTLDIPEDGSRSSFFFRDVKKEQCTTNRLKISVKGLPDGEPSSFTGGVGTFDMKAYIIKNTVQTGESIVLRMQITGDGDPKIVQAPIIPKIEGLEAYEPSLMKDETYIRADKVFMDKVFEYIFVPKIDSTYILKPEFTYFSPTSKIFETIKSDGFNVTVVKGGNSEVASLSNSNHAVFSPMEDSTSLQNMKSGFFGSKYYFFLIGLLLFLPLVTIYVKKKKFENAESEVLKAQKSINISLKNLQQASVFMSTNQPQEFYKEISHATIGYLQNKFKISNTELGLEEVKTKLKSLAISDLLISEYESIQQFCEKAKFAGQYEKMSEVYDRAAKFIQEIENNS